MTATSILCHRAEAADYHPISSVTTTSINDLWTVSNLIQGPGSGYSATEPHAQLGSGAGSRWVTDDPGGFPSDYIAVAGAPTLVFDLGQERALGEVSMWGYATTNSNGVSQFSLRFATAAEGTANFGTSIAYNPTFDPVIEDSARQSFAFSEIVIARYVEFTCLDNFYANGGNGPPGGGDRVGLGEVAFEDSVPNPNPIVDITPTALDFGNPPTYTGPATLTLTVANTGVDQALQIATATLPAGAPFAIAGIPATIAAGDSTDLDVTFDTAGAEGCFSTTLDLTTNDPTQPTVTVLLTAGINCVQPEPEKPQFSIAGGTFTGSIALTLSTPTPGAQIVYTMDGSLPTLANGTVYNDPITIDSTVQIRAATLSGAHDPAVATESYVRLAADLANYTSEIPILVVENFGAGTVPNKGWSTGSQTGGGLIQPNRQPAYMSIFDTDPAAGTASITAAPDTDSRIGIRVRGAFSSTWTPKPYSVEAWKQTGDVDRDIKPLGMPAEADWILYFPHPSYDRTMLNNTFTWELASETGRYGTRYRWVDVFVNEDGGDLRLSDRRGVYAFAEKVKRGGDRIDYDALSDDGTTGGWLLSINRMDAIPADGYPTENGATSPQFFHTPGPNRTSQTAANTSGGGDDIPRQYNAFINFENPNGYRINTAQRAAIENWFVEFENVFYDDALWLDPVDGYRQYVNTEDVITYFQLLNLGKQGDGLLLSMFPWVSSGERQLHMGPMWDFNNGAYGGSTNSPLYFRQDRLWYPRLFQDPSFLREYIDRWFELRRGPLSDANMHAIIDRQSAGIPDALVAGQGIALGTWQGRISAMKTWVSDRAGWIDSQYLAPPDFAQAGGIVGPGFALTLQNNTGQAGTIFYTLDGSDPIGTDDTTVIDTVLLDQGAVATTLVPSPANGGDQLTTPDWTTPTPPTNDGSWVAGTTGIGYDYAGLIGTDVEAEMRGTNGSAYFRVPFDIDAAALADWNRLTLRMKYDDGFVAYLNGVEIASANAPATPGWDSVASANHADANAVNFDDFDITEHLGALTAEPNMLAIHLLNAGTGSSDALALPQLVASEVDFGTPAAIAYTAPATLAGSARVRARLLTDGGSWSAINEATYVVGVPADSTNLVVSEIMYHPADDAGGGEFIELLNIHPSENIDLTGAAFSAGIDFDLPAGTVLAPGERLVITEAEFRNDTRLANGGERIALTGADAAVIFDFSYNDKAPWPELADGAGCSLVLIAPTTNPDPADPLNWRCSALAGGNPGTSDAIPLTGDLASYALGTAPPRIVFEGDLALFEFEQNLAAEEAIVSVELSDDLETWSPSSEPPIATTLNTDGTATLRVGVPAPRHFVRIAIRSR